MTQELGIYFSANDAVYNWAIAFLNSFRSFNPDLRLLLIPFNDQCDRLLKLQDTYDFELYTDASFQRLEAIGQAFELGHTSTGHYWFRRYAAFWGPCDRFMYLDARQVVLADLKPIITALDDYDFDFLHFDCAINQVYEPGELRRELLRQGKARGFNSGRWASRRGLFAIEEFETLSMEALKVRSQLNPRNTDQAFINYCCDLKPVRCGHAAELLGHLCQSSWANHARKLYKKNNVYYLWDYGGLDHKKQLVLLHWAGQNRYELMSQKKIFMNYFLLHESLMGKILSNIKELVYWPRQLFEIIRRSRVINNFYHSLNSRQADL